MKQVGSLGKNINVSYSSYTVNSPGFSVPRRYTDFLWLHNTLGAEKKGVVIPPLPDKSHFSLCNMFKCSEQANHLH